jgi:hypothetical protein
MRMLMLVRVTVCVCAVSGIVILAASEAEGEIEPMGSQIGPLRDQFLHGEIVVYRAPFQHHGTIADSEQERQVVIDDDHRSGKILEQFPEKPLLSGIEIGGGLIENEDFRVHGEYGRQRRTLLLSIAQMVGSLVEEPFERHVLNGVVNARIDFLPVESEIHRAEGDIFIKGIAKQLIVGILEEHTYPRADSL